MAGTRDNVIDRSADTAPAADRPGPDRPDIELLERQLMTLMHSLKHKHRERAAEFDSALPPAAFRTLVELVFLGATGATPLADAVGFDKSVMSRHLHQLEELGHVTRCQNPDDHRAVIISATPAAVGRIKALDDERRDAFRARLATWSARDVNELGRLLRLLSST